MNGATGSDTPKHTGGLSMAPSDRMARPDGPGGPDGVIIVVPGDDPPQLQGSPHLERLRRHGTVRLHADRPATLEEKLARARDAVCLLNTRGAVKWPAEALRGLPRLRMATVCGIGTDAFDLEVARELGIVVCNIPGKTAPIVAEHALGLMLAAAKRAHYQTAELKQGAGRARSTTSICGQDAGPARRRRDRRGHGPPRAGDRDGGHRLDVPPHARPRGRAGRRGSSGSTTSCGRPTSSACTSG